uniref:G-protein coupled receptors family 1 profile domain-containing protein n=1 Tax=Chrysemys picta bellii TaxID=8478 RepID=A0A8C3IAG0_CHRPI
MEETAHALNYTSSHPATFILLGIPGMEQAHVWLSIPFCLMYVVALLGNSVLLFTIITEPNLHEPMYMFLSMLTVADLLLSTTTVPKTLNVFWSLSKEISFNGCLTQMFFIDFIFITESAILLAMAFDRYVAICDPLRYTTVLTLPVIRKIAVAALTRSLCIMFPVIFLLKRLHYCLLALSPASGPGSHGPCWLFPSFLGASLQLSTVPRLQPAPANSCPPNSAPAAFPQTGLCCSFGLPSPHLPPPPAQVPPLKPRQRAAAEPQARPGGGGGRGHSPSDRPLAVSSLGAGRWSRDAAPALPGECPSHWAPESVSGTGNV